MVVPTRRALAAAAAGLALALLPLAAPGAWPAWAAFWGALAAALAVDAALLPPARAVALAAALPDPLPVGAEAIVGLTLRGAAGRALPVRLRLDLPDALEGPRDHRLVLRGGEARVEVPVRVRRRGRHALGAAWLRWPGPLGLVARTGPFPLDAAARAVPDLAGVQGAAMRAASDPELRAGLKVERYLGDGSEFDALEEFLPGHDRRAIDWKASARHRGLLVRRFRAERNHQVVLAVDTGRLMAEPVEGLPRLDHAIHAALLLGWAAVRTGDRVGLYAFDEAPRAWVACRAGARGFQALHHATADLAYGAAETNFTLGLTDLAGRLRRRSLVVVLTDFVDAVGAELMVDNLTRLARRHLTVFVALRDPLPEALVDAPPDGVDAMHRAVVAEGLLRERERVIRRLERLGVLCLDVLPGQAGPRLLDRYLDIKRRERI